MKGILIFSMALFFLTGCAFTRADLNVVYNQEKAKKGPLSSLKPMNVDMGEFVDKRSETVRIGYKRNGFGAKTADIVTKQPVAQIVRDALIAEFEKNGHAVSNSNKDIAITGEVTTFWFDMQINFATVEFMGTVGVNLSVVNSKTNEALLSQPYQGHYNEKSLGGLEGTWERVMNTALERMVNQVSTDPKFIKALQAI